MKHFYKRLPFILNIILYLTVFIFALYSPTDPDLGWHLKYGEYFWQHGTVLRDNTFSTLMPKYHWANTSWLTDVISYGTYIVAGFLGLTILSALIVTTTFFFFSRVGKLTLWDQAFLFPMLLYLEQPINAISFRGQQFTLLLIGVLFYLIGFYPKNKKIFALTIPLFLLWANLHGEFIFGLALFGIWIVLYLLVSITSTTGTTSLQKKFSLLARGTRGTRDTLFLFCVFVLCALVTLINPFGFGIHEAAISHIGSPLLKSISEYLPFPMRSREWWNLVVVGIGLVFGFIFLFFRGKLSEKIPYLGVGIVMFLLTFTVRRYAWPAYYMILPMLTPLTAFFKPDGKKMTQWAAGIFIVIVFGLAFYTRFPFVKYANFTWNDYCMAYATGCSPKSAEFLIKNHLTQNVFSLYGWGGWLIWNYPQIKPVVDGRMHLWKDEKGFSGFVYYYAYEQNLKEINDSPYNIVYMSPDKPLYGHMEDLVNAGLWKQIYRDEHAGIFVRNKTDF